MLKTHWKFYSILAVLCLLFFGFRAAGSDYIPPDMTSPEIWSASLRDGPASQPAGRTGRPGRNLRPDPLPVPGRPYGIGSPGSGHHAAARL